MFIKSYGLSLKQMLMLALATVLLFGCASGDQTIDEMDIYMLEADGISVEVDAQGRVVLVEGATKLKVGDYSEIAESRGTRAARSSAARSGVTAAEIGAENKVLFAYDSDNLSRVSSRSLNRWVDYLNNNPNKRIRIEGHCDERGTREYNIALGERRANKVRDYLVSRGVSRRRMLTVSYGEERPVDTAPTEAAWSKNRRVEVIPF